MLGLCSLSLLVSHIQHSEAFIAEFAQIFAQSFVKTKSAAITQSGVCTATFTGVGAFVAFWLSAVFTVHENGTNWSIWIGNVAVCTLKRTEKRNTALLCKQGPSPIMQQRSPEVSCWTHRGGWRQTHSTK